MRRFVLPAVLLIAALVFPSGATAIMIENDNDPVISCTTLWHQMGDTVPFVCVTESVNHSGDKLLFTGSSDDSNLNLLAHAIAGRCLPKTGGLDNWNDCISAVWVKLGTNDSVCLFRDSGYNDLIWWAAAPSSPAGGVWTYSLADFGGNNDVTSSVRLQQSGTDCPYL